MTVRSSGRVSTRAGRRRIVILTEDSKPALGGIAEYLHELALATSETHDVLVVTSVPGAEALNPGLPFRYREVAWFRQAQSRRGDGFMPMRRMNTLVWHLGRRRRVRRLLAGIHAEHPNSAYVLGRMSPVTHPWYVACGDLGLEFAGIAYGLELVEALAPAWARRRVDMVAAATHWFAISRDTASKLAAMGVSESRQSLLLPGVVMPRPADADDQSRRGVRERLGLGDDPFVLSLCHLRHRKGIDLAIEAFAAVAAEFPALRYVAAGAGPERDALAALARSAGVAGRVVFTGAIDEATKAALFAECEFFILPTRTEAHDVEGFGIVYLEAGSYGKAVIGGATGGVAEAIADGVTGMLVDTRDSAGLSHAMRDLLRDPSRRGEMGRRGAERACSDFAWPARGRAFAARIDEISDDRHRDTPVSTPSASAADRVRRQMGSASNRTLAAADVLGILARRGRLATYLSSGVVIAERDACSRAIMAWVQRAIEGGGGEGASARYHVTSGWAGAYPEITGYLISTLLHYATAWNDPELADAAARAGDWLARTRIAGGAICRKQWYPGNSTPSVFNTAQVVEGWCALARARNIDGVAAAAWTELARESGDWLLREQDASGIWIRHAFNGIPHTYYARVAAPLVRLAELTGDDRYAAAARRALDWVLAQQQSSGWFRSAGFTATEAPTTHTIGYVLEGLLQAGGLLGDTRYTGAAERAARALRNLFGLRGRLPGRLSSDWRPRARWRCLTGEAQVAISWCLLARSTGDTRYRQAAESVAESLQRRVRIFEAWPEISGAIPGSSPPWGEYDPFGYPTHAAKFTLDLFALLPA
jgi:glycosyltransferase involved in cell wall biosynthesis